MNIIEKAPRMINSTIEHDDKTYTAISYAVMKNYELKIRLLVEAGVNLNPNQDAFRFTHRDDAVFHPFMTINFYNLNLVKYLIDHGADINYNFKNISPLGLFLLRNQHKEESMEVVKYLIRFGARKVGKKLNINKDILSEVRLMIERFQRGENI